MPNDAIAASRFSVTVDGYEIAQFSELTGITTEVDVIDFMENSVRAAATSSRSFPASTSRPPSRSSAARIRRWSCGPGTRRCIHGDVVGARKSGSIVMYGYDGTAVARYHFHDGWPSKISIGALKAASSEVLMEEVTIVCEWLERVAP